jgi:hypothetical protein
MAAAMTPEIIANAIIAAISAGAVAETTDTAKSAIGEAYQGLKSLIKKKFGHANNADRAIDNLQAQPDSDAWKQILTGQLKVVNSSSDPELVSAAQSLLALIEALSRKAKNTSRSRREPASLKPTVAALRRSPCTLPPEGMKQSPRCFHRGKTTKTGVFVRPRPIVRPLRRLTNYS